MRGVLLGVCCLLAALSSGCASRQLSLNTVTQAHTHTDILYRQILNNVASSECNPDVLPHFAVVGTGGALVTDIASANFGLAWDAASLVGTTLGIGGEREVENGWTLAPVVDPDKLRAMRCAFQLTTRGETHDQAGYEIMRRYVGDEYLPWIEPGWYGAGGKHDVPKHACYVAHCGDRYVWVTHDGLEGLSRLTLVVLNIATLAPPAVEPQSRQIQEYHYEDGVLKRIETYRETTSDAATESVYPLRENYYNPLQSQIQMLGGGR